MRGSPYSPHYSYPSIMSYVRRIEGRHASTHSGPDILQCVSKCVDLEVFALRTMRPKWICM